MRAMIEATSLAYRGVLIERPCAFCDTTSIHMDNLCNEGPCSICGVRKHVDGWASHPATADGIWRGNYSEPLHDWTAHEYLPADVDEDLPAFEQIVDTARTLGMPERYTSDLFRDYQFVQRSGPDFKLRFAWIVRQWGTHIVGPYLGWQGALRWLEDNEKSAQCFWWNGYVLQPTNFDTLRVLLAAHSGRYVAPEQDEPTEDDLVAMTEKAWGA